MRENIEYSALTEAVYYILISLQAQDGYVYAEY